MERDKFVLNLNKSNTMIQLKKRKTILIIALCMITCFILYQFYFFLALTSETTNRTGNVIIPVYDHLSIKEVVHIRSEADRFISKHGSIKGVLYQHMVQYRPDALNEFKCLNSEQRIPFDFLNDDYCDCGDGTDEPSTSACPNGTFYCDTQSQRKSVKLNLIPSGKVNDGICDCCDGSDEWILEMNSKLLGQATNNHYRYYVTVCANDC